MKNSKFLFEVKLPSNKKFGITFSLIFLFAGLWFFFKSSLNFSYFLLSLSFILLLAATLFPDKLHTFNLLWAAFGKALQSLISPLALGLIFFLVITPTALISTMFGRDHLGIKKTKPKTTYWIKRDIDKKISFMEQF